MVVSLLLDTNIIIYREDNNVIEDNHENSFKDIDNDKNISRREIVTSKMKSYQILKTHYDFQKDTDFVRIVGYDGTSNEYVDNSLLYSLLKGETTFLITNDNGIHKKAKKLDKTHENISERVFNISEALNYFEEKIPKFQLSILL